MKVVVFTTDTPHHLFFLVKLSESYKISKVFLETDKLLPNFKIEHSYEKLRDEYERTSFLQNNPFKFNDIAETLKYKNINSPEAVLEIQNTEPDIVIVFGTGRLLKTTLECSPKTLFLNLHGGNPEMYKGLDSHLWSIYHNDFINLVSCIHFMDSKLDTGDIVGAMSLNISKNMKLYQLRSVNTMACVDLTIMALSTYSKIGRIPSRKQVLTGRYYSFMPAELKEICVKKFEEYSVKESRNE